MRLRIDSARACRRTGDRLPADQIVGSQASRRRLSGFLPVDLHGRDLPGHRHGRDQRSRDRAGSVLDLRPGGPGAAESRVLHRPLLDESGLHAPVPSGPGRDTSAHRRVGQSEGPEIGARDHRRDLVVQTLHGLGEERFGEGVSVRSPCGAVEMYRSGNAHRDEGVFRSYFSDYLSSENMVPRVRTDAAQERRYGKKQPGSIVATRDFERRARLLAKRRSDRFQYGSRLSAIPHTLIED